MNTWLYGSWTPCPRIVAATPKGEQAKTTSYGRTMAALRRAASEGFGDALFTNEAGEITEASFSNVFFLAREGDGVRFVTPARASGLLGTERAGRYEQVIPPMNISDVDIYYR